MDTYTVSAKAGWAELDQEGDTHSDAGGSCSIETLADEELALVGTPAAITHEELTRRHSQKMADEESAAHSIQCFVGMAVTAQRSNLQSNLQTGRPSHSNLELVAKPGS